MNETQDDAREESALIDERQALGYEPPETTSSYDERDVALYALGVGAARDPLDLDELRFVWEGHAEFCPFPTFGVVPVSNVLLQSVREGRLAPGLRFGIDRILHSEQYLELKRPLPPRARLTHRLKVTDIFDRGRNAVVVTEARSLDACGELLVLCRFTIVVRGAGGWGGSREPTREAQLPPERAPDTVIQQRVEESQALLYRLSGDLNPLHVDPGVARDLGLPRPVLHGLCTLGYAARHLLKALAGNDPRAFKSIQARFSGLVFPGETLVTEIWREAPSRVLFRCRALERDKTVVSHAAMELASGR